MWIIDALISAAWVVGTVKAFNEGIISTDMFYLILTIIAFHLLDKLYDD